MQQNKLYIISDYTPIFNVKQAQDSMKSTKIKQLFGIHLDESMDA